MLLTCIYDLAGTALSLLQPFWQVFSIITNIYSKIRSICRNKNKLILTDASVYTGDIVNGHAHGHGKFVYPNGDIYQGAMRNNMKHGRGTMSYADGSTYVGDFVNDMRHGCGCMDT